MRSALLGSLVAMLVLPAAASAEIVPQRSIMGVQLQMTEAEVRSVAGEPDSVRSRPHEIMGRYTQYRYGRTKIGLGEGSGVFFVSTRDRSERTATGIGVGSRKRAVRRRLSGERCRNEYGIHHCWLGRWRAGRTVTDFRLNRKKRVKQVTLAIVID